MRTLRFEVREDVGWLWLARPEKHNAQNALLAGEMVTLLDTLVEENVLRALVVIGEGPSFSSGLDLEESPEGFPGEHVERLAAAPWPTVAAIRGYALGGGLELALACDVRIGTPDCQLGFPEVTVGRIPSWGGTQRLSRLVGPGLASEMVLTGEPIDAARAAAAGLLNRIVANDALEASAGALAATMARQAPLAVRYAKEAIQRGLDLPLAHALEVEGDLYVLLEATEDRREGIAAFREKRPPRWRSA
ncbi:MAG: enoyl-CoA hydratase/isomerase family protein [Chloroflexota bacterium]|nr:enoyl-CoA hydratase/isomerase family protein [Dehalococcoidia bacterium]MDW8253267.1 enoyl-CoA hydratase/isomerase family protein [Chloroflexota bacterium]